ncbi:MAG: hypothetical protein KAT75_00705 [Dehalococcoidia bacterium]|nr:hypothetical protein [Dehalococcoidia bacterium]
MTGLGENVIHHKVYPYTYYKILSSYGYPIRLPYGVSSSLEKLKTCC